MKHLEGKITHENLEQSDQENHIYVSIYTFTEGMFVVLCPYQSAVSSVLDEVCSVLPIFVSGQCSRLVQRLVKKLFEVLLNAKSPNSICSVLRLCQSSTPPRNSQLSFSFSLTLFLCPLSVFIDMPVSLSSQWHLLSRTVTRVWLWSSCHIFIWARTPLSLRLLPSCSPCASHTPASCPRLKTSDLFTEDAFAQSWVKTFKCQRVRKHLSSDSGQSGF